MKGWVKVKDSFSKYLVDLDMPGLFQEKVKELYDFYTNILSGEEIEDIFVCDYITTDRKRDYTNLWFFTPSYAMECKGFLHQKELDMVPIKSRIVRWEIKFNNYDFKETTTESRLSIYCEFSFGVTAELQSTSLNCDKLKNIFLSYIVPNLQK